MQVTNNGSPFNAPVPLSNSIPFNSTNKDPYDRHVTLVSSDGKEFSIHLSMLKPFESLSNPFIDGLVGESLSLSLDSLTLENLVDFFKDYNNPDQTLRWSNFNKSLLSNLYFTHKIEAEREKGKEKEKEPEGDERNFLHELQSLYLFSESHFIKDLSDFILRFIQKEDVLNLYSEDSFGILLSYLENPSDLQLPPYKVLWYLAIKKALINNDSDLVRNLVFCFIKHFGQEHLKSLIEPLEQKEKLLFLFTNRLLEELDNGNSPESNLDSILELLENCNFWNIFMNIPSLNVLPYDSNQLQGLCLQAKLLEATAIDSERLLTKPLAKQPETSTTNTQFFILLKQLVNRVTNTTQASKLINKITFKITGNLHNVDLTQEEASQYKKFFPLSHYAPNSRAYRLRDIIFKETVFSLINCTPNFNTTSYFIVSYISYLKKNEKLDKATLKLLVNSIIKSIYGEFLKNKPYKFSQYLQVLDNLLKICNSFAKNNYFSKLEEELKVFKSSGGVHCLNITEVDIPNPEETLKRLAVRLPPSLIFIAQYLVAALASHMQISEESRVLFKIDGLLKLNPPTRDDTTITAPQNAFFDQLKAPLRHLLIPQNSKEEGETIRPLKKVHDALDAENMFQTLTLLHAKERSKNKNLKVQFIESAISRGNYEKSFEIANAFEKSDRRTCLYLIFTSLYDKGDLEMFDELRSKLEQFKDAESQELNINLLLYAFLEKHSVVMDNRSEFIQFVKEILIPKLQKLEIKNPDWDQKFVLVLLSRLLASNDRQLMELIFEFSILQNIEPKKLSQSKKWSIQDFILSAKLYLEDNDHVVKSFKKSKTDLKYVIPFGKALELKYWLRKNDPSDRTLLLTPHKTERLCAHLKHILSSKSSSLSGSKLQLLNHLSRELLLNIRHFQDKDPGLAKKLLDIAKGFEISMLCDLDVISDLLFANFHLSGEDDPFNEQIIAHLISQTEVGTRLITPEYIATRLAVRLALGKEKYKKLFINLINNPKFGSLPEFAMTYFITLDNILEKKELYLFMSEIPLSWDHACITHFSFNFSECQKVYQHVIELEAARKNYFHYETDNEQAVLTEGRKRKRVEEKGKEKEKDPKVKKPKRKTSNAKRKAEGLEQKKAERNSRKKGKEKLP